MTDTAQESKKNLEEMLTAMETPEKWKAFKTAKNKLFTKQIDKEKADAFSDYLTSRFIETCNDKTIAGRFFNWKIRSGKYKIDLASDIINLFMLKIKDDIFNDRVTIYTNSGETYKKTNDLIDQNYKQDITSAIKEIKVEENTNLPALMATETNGNVHINTDSIFYNANEATFFLMDLRHELTHVVDSLIPQISPLDPKILKLSMFYYENEGDLYSNNPLELSANTKRKEYRIKIEEMLKAQEQTFYGKTKQLN